MLIDDKALERFRGAYRDATGVALETERASEMAQRLLTLYAVLLKSPRGSERQSLRASDGEDPSREALPAIR